jgi:hypothetical protein
MSVRAAVGHTLEPAQAWLWLDPSGPDRSGRLAADEEHGRVVIQRVADVT